MKKITLVVPVFNEEQAIPIFYEKVRAYDALKSYSLSILFVNDGSKDKTEEILRELISRDSLVSLLNFSRNFGKEPALMAGLEHAEGDAVIPMDVDLQDPIEVLPELLAKWEEGWEVVLARRVDRSEDSALKRGTASLFYRFYNKISSLKIEENVGDFRLMSARAVKAVCSMPERNLFMKGMLSWVGFKTTCVDYVRASRSAGETKFNGWKLWNLAVEGITAFSVAPLKIWTYLGAFVAFLSLLYGGYFLTRTLIWGNPIPGYPSIMVAILFFGGVQLISIGVLGEYLGRVYLETKGRPRYLIQDFVKGKGK